MFVGLVRDPGDQPPPEPGPERPRRLPHLPWRPFAFVALWCWLMYGAGELGGLAGYLLVVGTVALGCWRVDRWLARQYWGGLRESQRT